MTEHAVHRLYQQRLMQSTKPFNARGGRVNRCRLCRVDHSFCMCALRPTTQSNCAFLLLYYDDEVLKPSNTGRLIADVIEDTFAFIWHRTETQQDVLNVLNDPQWQPVVVFPDEYCAPSQTVYKGTAVPVFKGKRPLFVMLDGSWREAKKMFRKSSYLAHLPVMSITPERQSEYFVRKAAHSYQLATAEVASYVLSTQGEEHNAKLLNAWFDVFSYRYQQGVKRENRGDAGAEQRLQRLISVNLA